MYFNRWCYVNGRHKVRVDTQVSLKKDAENWAKKEFITL